MALQYCRARPRKHIVDSRHAVCTGCCELVARLVEAGIEHLVIVTTELLDTLPSANIPQARCPVNATCQAVVSCEIELPTGKLS